MAPTKSTNPSETTNHSVLQERPQLSHGMYTRAMIAKMTPAHVKVESKAIASPNPVFTFASTRKPVTNPLEPRRSNRLAGVPITLNLHTPTTPNFDSPSCPPSFMKLRSRTVATNLAVAGGRVGKSSRVTKSSKVVKKPTATAIVSPIAEKMYKAIMKSHPSLTVQSRSMPALASSVVSSRNEAHVSTQVTVPSQATFANQPQASDQTISYNDLTLRIKSPPNHK
ncbi:hypothetical protein VTL71DRAFT_14915 [Oculimacula yallundae]|uniref:Uncharacterized protein n=1 Tax=Oculimacula yallundae TaxID=86028 RepID=A0ABR4CF81_9HELO